MVKILIHSNLVVDVEYLFPVTRVHQNPFNCYIEEFDNFSANQRPRRSYYFKYRLAMYKPCRAH